MACEVLIATDAVRNIIRKRGASLLRNAITTGGKHGMVAMAQSVGALLEAGLIQTEVADAVLYNYAK